MNHFPEYNNELYQSKYYLYDYIQVYVSKYKHINFCIEKVYQKKIKPEYSLKLHNSSIKQYIKWLIS